MGSVWVHADSFLRCVASPFHSFVTALPCQFGGTELRRTMNWRRHRCRVPDTHMQHHDIDTNNGFATILQNARISAQASQPRRHGAGGELF